jgi:signal transduction histidine kinase/DNA-binding response OmpR family regulator
MMAVKNPVILTIDDESVIRDSIRAYLEDYDYTVLEADNGRAGLQIYEKEHVDLILVDLRMPEVDGLEVLSVVSKRTPDLPIIVISGTGEIADVVEALRLGAWDYLLKPITDMSILIHSIEKGLERARLIKENKRYHEGLEELVAQKTIEISSVNSRLKEVVESTKKLLGCGELGESGALLLQEFAHHMDAGSGSIYKVTKKGLKRIASLDADHGIDLIPFPLDEGSVYARVIEDKEPLFLSDFDGGDSTIPQGYKSNKYNSLLLFPLTDGMDDVLAIILLHSNKELPYVSQDRDIGRILTSYSCEALRMAYVSAALKDSEDRLQQAQKMEAIGTLAGGIAHDFNNILAAIIGYTDLSLFSGSCDDIVRRNLGQVKKASNRARDLVSQILAFSRTEEFTENAVDLGPILKEALKLLRATIPSSVAIDFDIPDGLGRVMTDPTRIYQVLMNLCTNAAHAMQNQEGVLTVRFAKVEDEAGSFERNGSQDSQWLRLSVSDTGRGMQAEMLNRIFEPYFTTKEKGEGTGLGLAVVHGIVRASGGTVKVESQLGKGSTFHLYFPCVPAGMDVMEDSSFQQMRGGRERVLFVDDEITLAEMAGEMLKNLGYVVKILSSSTDALQLFKEKPGEFDLLITDQTMPDLSGMDLAGQVLRLRPDLPVVLYTGNAAAIDVDEAKQLGIREILIKPLGMSVLAEAVRRTLDG